MTKEITQIINGLVSDIDNTIDGVYDAINERTNVCKTKWSRVGKIVTDDTGREYRITEIEIDEWIKATPIDSANTDPLTGVIYLTSPFYISGTKIATNNEWTLSSNDLTTKTPLTWLLEIIRVRKYGRGNTIDFESDIRLFFLDETDI